MKLNPLSIKSSTFFTLLIFVTFFLSPAVEAQSKRNKPDDDLLIRRTDYGVPHIQAKSFKDAGFAMGYVQMEDYGKRVAEGLIRARGEWAKVRDLEGDDLMRAIDRDAVNRRNYSEAIRTWPLLDIDTRDIMEGFAEGVNHYLKKHAGETEPWIKPDFTGYDVHAYGIGGPSQASIQKFLRALHDQKVVHEVPQELTSTDEALNSTDGQTVWARISADFVPPHSEAGSNVWALAPKRTASGKAILVRNPHLNWNAGYYEAHVTIGDQLNFYGDFRIGSPVGIVGGFNEHLGFSTTNNYPLQHEFYAFEADPDLTDHYLLDGVSIPISREWVTVEFKNGNALSTEKREFLFTPYGPVIHRGNGKIYIIKSTAERGFKSSEQFLKMMKAKNLDEWKDAMRMQAKNSSNLTYADAEGNIFYVWNAASPDLPEPWGGDTTAVFVSKSTQIWKDIIEFDRLPQILNPKGGFLHNENDPFHYTSPDQILKHEDFPAYFSEPKLGLRSQKGIELIEKAGKKLSLEEVVRLKYDEGMLLADRVKDDLISAGKNARLTGEVAEAMEMLAKWNNTVEASSVGSVLFKTWWDRYVFTADSGKVAGTPQSVGFAATPEKLFQTVWTPTAPFTTPYGLADTERALAAFEWAVAEAKRKYGSWSVSWGDVHRVIAGKNINEAIGGGNGILGIFRVMWFNESKFKGLTRHRATGGDCWVLAVEFGKTPKAYSVLVYGQSNQRSSPHYYDQLQLFRDGKMKPVAFSVKDVRKGTVRVYSPRDEK